MNIREYEIQLSHQHIVYVITFITKTLHLGLDVKRLKSISIVQRFCHVLKENK